MTPKERAQKIDDIGRLNQSLSLGPHPDAPIVKNYTFLLDELAATRRAMYLAADALQHCRGCRSCGEDGCDSCDRCTAATALPAVREIMELDLAVWHNGYDWVIAPVGDGDAGPRAVMRTHSGDALTDEECDAEGWERLSDDSLLKIRDDEDRDATSTELTCREWIARAGCAGFLCSTNY